MARDRKVYGFRKPRAEALLALPLSGDAEFPEVRPRERRSRATAGSRKVGFELTADLTTTSAAANFYELDGAAIGDLIEVGTLYDPHQVTAGVMKSGWVGYATQQDGKYYFDNAACNQQVT